MTARTAVRTTLLLSRSDGWPDELIPALVAAGSLTVVLLDGAADLARPSHPDADRLAAIVAADAAVLVDESALRRRGIGQGRIAAGVKPTDLAAVADLLVDATDKAVWL